MRAVGPGVGDPGCVLAGAVCQIMASRSTSNATLRSAAALAAGRPAPSLCRAVRVSGALLKLADVAAVAARETEAAKHRAAAMAAICAEQSSERARFLSSEQVITDSLLSVAQAAERLDLTPQRVRQLASAQRIKGARTARRE